MVNTRRSKFLKKKRGALTSESTSRGEGRCWTRSKGGRTRYAWSIFGKFLHKQCLFKHQIGLVNNAKSADRGSLYTFVGYDVFGGVEISKQGVKYQKKWLENTSFTTGRWAKNFGGCFWRRTTGSRSQENETKSLDGSGRNRGELIMKLMKDL